ncbi:GNAT family N-acetyltransferase [Streptomyces sp. NPDC048057]|uniref:GNAT family N-acetyltransferase n=1 Tax=Streptomyces sp. NPDC048057 TaxID=3155628 RepID=UPI0033CE1183
MQTPPAPPAPPVHIRQATAEDWPAIWPFFRTVIAAGETFTYPTDLTSEQGRDLWLLPAPDRTVVAVDDAGAVLGTAKMNRNQQGNGSHVASASYLVDPAHSRRGVGRALCTQSIDWARARGFRAIQYNAVVETNVHAVKLYESLGFTVVGTVPEGFHHPVHGYIGLHVMHLAL